MAPALVALMASMESRPSSSSLSSTPQAKAPCAPPPCSARLTGFVLAAALLAFDGDEALARLGSRVMAPSIRFGGVGCVAYRGCA